MNNACVAVPGAGDDQCDPVLGCGDPTHTECQNDTCVTVQGPGANGCTASIPCGTHMECQSLACVLVNTPGTNQCADDAGCLSSSSSSLSSSSLTSGASTSTLTSDASSSTISGFSSIINPSSGHSSSSSIIGPFHFECVFDACVQVPGTGTDACDPILGCGTDSHTVCRGTECVSVPGEGDNECVGTIPCETRTQCVGLTCTLIPDDGLPNECGDSNPCTSSSANSLSTRSNVSTRSGVSTPSYMKCENHQCVRVQGNGTDECDRILGCGTPEGHFACINGQCAVVQGSGPNECSDVLLCGQRTVCSNNACITLEQSGGNECLNNAECLEQSFSSSSEPLVQAGTLCGNGVLEPPEECDDGNRRDNDGCTSTCMLEIGICGDGIVQSLLNEQCEPSRHDPALPYACSPRCRFASPTCGNGQVEDGEECDAGLLNANAVGAPCRADCGAPRCGDGILDAPQELCDDGNRLQGDGCDRYCRVEIPTKERPPEPPQRPTQVAQGFQPFDFFNPNQVAAFRQAQHFGFPHMPNMQALPNQLPLAQLMPIVQSQGPVGDTGPATVAVVGAGMAAGWSWVRRKRK